MAARHNRPADRARTRPTRNWGRILLLCATTAKGLTAERWRHMHGCGRFFNCVRDTVSDKFVATYKAGLPKTLAVSRRAAPRQRKR